MAALSSYSFKERFLIRAADLAFYLSIKLIGATVKFEVVGEENRQAIKSASKLPIYALWHDRIFLGTYFLRDLGLVVLTSKSFDGEYIARFIRRFGYGAIRGSSSRGGAKALISMIKAMKEGLPMAFTIDGPRGPRHLVKPGAVLLAKKTGNPLLPFIVQPKRFFTVNSWDKMQIPFPFTKALVLIGEPIYVGIQATEKELEAKISELQSVLDQMVEHSERWAAE